MGKSSTFDEHMEVLFWASAPTTRLTVQLMSLNHAAIKATFGRELNLYFRLCALARSKSAASELSLQAHNLLFSTRASMEKKILRSLDDSPLSFDSKLEMLTNGNFYGSSKKQGVSLRMPLSTCQPTALCANGCYAHDVLDASPNAVIRGAINGWIASQYEKATEARQSLILESLTRHSTGAIKNAKRELLKLPENFNRRPYIRFSHVGEVVAFPNFANALARQIHALSNGEVDCVVYTRLKQSSKLDDSVWIINFTLDSVSHNRLSWAPRKARIVYSAFGGLTSSIAEVNFLEHHRHFHSSATQGAGKLCPATLPDTANRTCDGCRCNRCFVRPSSFPNDNDI